MPVTSVVTQVPRVCIPACFVRGLEVDNGTGTIKLRYDFGPANNLPPTLRKEIRERPAKLEDGELHAVADLTQPHRPIGREVLESFLMVETLKDAEQFVRAHGPLTLVMKGWRMDGESTPLGGSTEFSFAFFRRKRDRLLALYRVWTALRRKEALLSKTVKSAVQLGFNYGSSAEALVIVALNQELAARSRVVVESRDGQLLPALYCDDLYTGLYALAYRAIIAGEPTALCAKCEKPFTVDKPGKKFCRVQCQNADKSRRARERQKRRGTKKRKGGK